MGPPHVRNRLIALVVRVLKLRSHPWGGWVVKAAGLLWGWVKRPFVWLFRVRTVIKLSVLLLAILCVWAYHYFGVEFSVEFIEAREGMKSGAKPIKTTFEFQWSKGPTKSDIALAPGFEADLPDDLKGPHS